MTETEQPYTEEALIEALAVVLGEKPVHAMLEAHVSLPAIHDMAMVELFLYPGTNSNPNVRLIRQAGRDLKKKGVYNYV